MSATIESNRPIGVPAAGALVLAMLMAGLATGCGGAPPEAAPEGVREPVTVAIEVVAERPVGVAVEATATVEPWRRTTPGTKVLGRIDRVPVREGQRVSAGGVLAELESGDLEAAVRQAEAALAMAEAEDANARAMERRMRELHARGSATEKNLEDAEAGARVAGAAVEQARAAVVAAEVTLGYATIRSPVAGWVVDRRVEAGDMASPGMPLFVVEDLSQVKVVVDVPESAVVGLEPGAPVEVTVPVLEETRTGQVDGVVPAGDPRSRTYRVHVVLSNPEGRMHSGMFARARFPKGSREAVTVPVSAMVRRGQLDGLFVVGDDGRARLRWVRVRPVAGDHSRVEVTAGLAAGERILIGPPPSLADGDPVREG